MRQRIFSKQRGQRYVLAASCSGKEYARKQAYNVAKLVLWAVVVAGSQLFVGSEQDCKDLAVELRMRNIAADWVKA